MTARASRTVRVIAPILTVGPQAAYHPLWVKTKSPQPNNHTADYLLTHMSPGDAGRRRSGVKICGVAAVCGLRSRLGLRAAAVQREDV